jgi:DHA1 family tetracycline resistance protein-like MFS transporter
MIWKLTNSDHITVYKWLIMNFIAKRAIVFSLFLVLFIDGLGIAIVLPLFPDMFLSSEKGILDPSTSEQFRNFIYGISIISFSLGMFFGSPMLGQLSDKFGRKKVILYSLWGTVIGYILSGIGVAIKSPMLFILGRIVDGLTAGSIPVAQAAISDISPENKKVGNIGLILFAVTSGYIVGPLASDYLIHKINLSLYTPFFATALLSFISILLLLPLKETNTSKTKGKSLNILSSFNTLTLLRKVSNAKTAILAFLFFQFGWTMYFQFIPHFLTSTAQSDQIGHVLAIIGIGMALSFCFLTRIFQNIFTTLMGAIITTTIIILNIYAQIAFQNNLEVVMITALCASLCYGLGYSFLLIYLSQKVEKNLQGLIMGISASMSALASAFTALIGSAIVNITFELTYILATTFFIMCFLSLLFEKVNFHKQAVPHI